MINKTIIAILFTLFVASTVNERIIDFLKTHFPTVWMKHFNFIDEIKRLRRLWLLSFFMGIFTASIIGINLQDYIITPESIDQKTENNIKAFKSDFVPETLTNLANYLNKNWESFMWLIITAVFISLGSKFWHDLLDIALYAKRVRRKIDNFDAKQIDKIEQVDKYLNEDDFAIAIKALDANRKRLEIAYGEYVTMQAGYEYIDNQYRVCIQIFDRSMKKQTNNEPANSILKRNLDGINKLYKHYLANVPQSITYTTYYGYIFRFPIVTYYPGEARTTDEVAARGGGGLFNSAFEDNKGTFGCIVLDEDCQDYFLLTCCHCVIDRQTLDWSGSNIDKGNTTINYKNRFEQESTKIGELYRAYRSDKMDIALVKADKPEEIGDYKWSYNLTVPIKEQEVTVEDMEKRRKVWFSGLTSGSGNGYIISNKWLKVKVNYGKDRHGETDYHILRDLIVFSANKASPYKSPCKPGDSGSIIIDAENYNALGMVVAADDEFAYAIPIKDILDLHGLTLSNYCPIDKH